MSDPAIRAANEAGSAVLVLSARLDRLIWGNAAGMGLSSPEPFVAGEVLPPALPLVRQIRSAERNIAAGATSRIFLRPASGGMIAAEIGPMAVKGTPAALLVAGTPVIETPVAGTPVEAGDGRERARSFLAAAGLDGNAAAAAVSLDAAVVARTEAMNDEMAAALAPKAQAFLQGGESHTVLDSVTERMTLARVASDLALVQVEALPAGSRVDSGSTDAAEPVEDEGARRPADEPTALPTVPLMTRHFDSRFDGPTSGPTADAAAPEAAVAADAADAAVVEAATDEEGTAQGVAVDAAPSEAEPPASDDFAVRFDREPIRFVWQIDEAGHFRSLSPEFAAAVGPRAADVIGQSFVAVAAVFGFDGDGAVARLLERRNTWSGRTILWPAEGSDRLVPVDLAALPMFGRDRRFEGFRGFGVVRMSDRVSDPKRLGERLARGPVFSAAPDPAAQAAQAIDPGAWEEGALDPHPGATAGWGSEDRPSFGRRARVPEIAPTDPQVVSFEERRRSREGLLTETEEAAFRAIGAELSPPVEAAPEPPRRQGDSPEQMLAQSGAVSALSALPLPVLVQVRDVLVFANREFFRFTGFADLADLTRRGGLDALFAEGGEPLDEGEVRIRRADESLVRALAHLGRISLGGRSALIISFVPVESGTLESAIGERAGEDARETEIEDLRAALDVATDGVVLLDGEGRVSRMNGAAEALFGSRPETYVGAEFAALLAPESRTPMRDYLATSREGGLAGVLNRGREVVAGVDGGAVPLFVSLGRLSGGRGWCAVIRDIAQWKRIEGDLTEARRQAEEASLGKSRFLANIIHELRTPLNAIIGFADIIASECFGPVGHPRYVEYLGDIRRSGHHLLDLVNDLLDMSKIEAGKAELSFEPVVLNEVVAEVVSLMQPQANRQRVIVRSSLPSSVPPVAADRRSLRQIALNLLANAIRFTPAGGQIIVSTAQRRDGAVTLRFRDSGIGMTDAEIGVALSPFRQVNPGVEERGEGTGLGLPLTKAMAEANRAEFVIASSPGEGTLVEIVFPPSRVLAG